MTPRQIIATQILAGFAANPAVFASNEHNGWDLVNCTDAKLVAVAYRLADALDICEPPELTDDAPIVDDGITEKAGHWFACLTECAKLLDLPDDEPIPSGVVKAVAALTAKAAHTAIAAEAAWIQAFMGYDYGPEETADAKGWFMAGYGAKQ